MCNCNLISCFIVRFVFYTTAKCSKAGYLAEKLKMFSLMSFIYKLTVAAQDCSVTGLTNVKIKIKTDEILLTILRPLYNKSHPVFSQCETLVGRRSVCISSNSDAVKRVNRNHEVGISEINCIWAHTASPEQTLLGHKPHWFSYRCFILRQTMRILSGNGKMSHYQWKIIFREMKSKYWHQKLTKRCCFTGFLCSKRGLFVKMLIWG